MRIIDYNRVVKDLQRPRTMPGFLAPPDRAISSSRSAPRYRGPQRGEFSLYLPGRGTA
jgi:hypothetical protein